MNRRIFLREILPFLGFLILTVIMTWPWALYLRDAVAALKPLGQGARAVRRQIARTTLEEAIRVALEECEIPTTGGKDSE